MARYMLSRAMEGFGDDGAFLIKNKEI